MSTMKGFQLLPPAPHLCQQCAVSHASWEPHDKDSLHYQYWFYARNGRWPVWKDAIAHCEPQARAELERFIREAGAWQEPSVPEVLPAEDHSIGRVTKRAEEGGP